MEQRKTTRIKQLAALLIMAFTPFFYGLSQTGQPVPVEISKDKVVIDGEIYYIHTVKKGQTLYSISKAYDVSQEVILEENPSASVDLKAEQPLKIPADPATEQPGKVYRDDDFYYHQVEKGQTLYFLSKKYEVSQHEIVMHNPGADTLLKVGDVIKVPKDENNYNKRNFVKEDHNYHYHRVRWLETLYSISKEYDVSQEEIIAANIELEDGLKSGQVIRIPKKRTLTDTIVYSQQLDTLDTLQVEPVFKTFTQDQCDSIAISYTREKPVHVALLMPFHSDFIYQLYQRGLTLPTQEDEEEEEDMDDEKDEGYQLRFRSAYFIEFYHGVLLAVEQLKKEGVDIDLHVFDTRRDTSEVKKILKKLEFLDLDVIIGPAFPENIKQVAGFAKEQEIALVSPFSSQNQVSHNPFMFQVMPPDTVQLNYFSRYIEGMMNENRSLILHDGDSLLTRKLNYLQHQLSSYTINKSADTTIADTTVHITSWNDTTLRVRMKDTTFYDTTYSYQIDVVQLPLEKVHKIVDTLSQEKMNDIVVFSDDMAYVNQVVSQLNTFSKKYDIRVFGLPEMLKNHNLDIEFIHNVELGVYSPFYLNVKDKKTQGVLRKFHTTFGYMPERITNKGYTFGLLGYDVATYFIQLVNRYDEHCFSCSPFYNPDLLLGDFIMQNINRTGGYMNTSVYFVQHTKDYEIVIMHITGNN